MKYIKLFENFESGGGDVNTFINNTINTIKKHLSEDVDLDPPFKAAQDACESYVKVCATFVEIVRFFITRRYQYEIEHGVEANIKPFNNPISDLRNPFKELRQYCKDNLSGKYDLGKKSDFTDGIYSGDSAGRGGLPDMDKYNDPMFIEFNNCKIEFGVQIYTSTSLGWVEDFTFENWWISFSDSDRSEFIEGEGERESEIDFNQLKKLLELSDEFANYKYSPLIRFDSKK